MKILRIGYYKWLKNKNILNQYKINRLNLADLIKEIHNKKPSYGLNYKTPVEYRTLLGLK